MKETADIGKSKEFAEVSEAAGEIAPIVKDTRVVGIEFVPYGTTVGGVKIGQIGDGSPAVTVPSKELVISLLDPTKHYHGTVPAALMSDSKPDILKRGVVLAHELGHARALMTRDPNNNQAALRLENKARKVIGGASAPIRKSH